MPSLGVPYGRERIGLHNGESNDEDTEVYVLFGVSADAAAINIRNCPRPHTSTAVQPTYNCKVSYGFPLENTLQAVPLQYCREIPLLQFATVVQMETVETPN
jgi:hypothetical protein